MESTGEIKEDNFFCLKDASLLKLLIFFAGLIFLYFFVIAVVTDTLARQGIN